jgi:hypothetical protein
MRLGPFVFAVVLVAACDGVGVPVVGERPLEPDPPMNACFAVRCDEVLEPRAPVWRPDGPIGAALASCAERTTIEAEAASFALDPDALGSLRCVDLHLVADAPFTIDLREVPIVGARIDVTSSAPGTLLLGGAVTTIDLAVHGPVEVRVLGGAVGASHVLLDGAAPDRLASLTTDAVLVTDLVVEAPYGLVRAHQSHLARVALEASEVELELSSVADGAIAAERISLLDAVLARVDLAADVIVGAAGDLSDVDVTRCGEMTLAVVDVIRTHVARCTEALVLDDVDLERSLVDADVLGSGRIRHSGLRGARVELESSRLTLTALCGVESLSVWTTSVECPSCEPAAPPEICGAPAMTQRYCPGYETAPCEGQPRPIGP